MLRSPSVNKSEKEILNWIQYVKTDFWYNHQMPVRKRAIFQALGLVPGVLFDVLKNNSSIIDHIEERRIVFLPQTEGQAYHKKSTGLPMVVWLDPIEFVIPKLGKIWHIFARCLTCQGNKFLPVMIDGTKHFACYHCIPPSQYTSIGAGLMNEKLIVEAVKRDYL